MLWTRQLKTIRWKTFRPPGEVQSTWLHGNDSHLSDLPLRSLLLLRNQLSNCRPFYKVISSIFRGPYTWLLMNLMIIKKDLWVSYDGTWCDYRESMRQWECVFVVISRTGSVSVWKSVREKQPSKGNYCIFDLLEHAFRYINIMQPGYSCIPVHAGWFIEEGKSKNRD